MTERRDEFEALMPESAIGAEAARSVRIGERMLDAEIEWRPRGVGAVLDLGFDLLRSRFASCFILASIMWVPWRFLSVLIGPSLAEMQRSAPENPFVIFAAIMGSNVLAWIAQSIVTAFVARLLYEAAFGRDSGSLAVLAFVLRRLPGLLVLGMVNAVMLLAATCACFLPVFGMTWALAPLMHVYVIEEVGLGGALKRSFKLSFEELFSWPAFYAFWRWAGMMLITTWLVFPLSGLVGVFELPEARTWISETWHWSDATVQVVSVVVGSLFLGAATAVQAGIVTAYYIDLRVRRDGLDLGGWFARLRGADATPAGERSAAS